MRRMALALISFYQLCLSPFLGNSCRFYPSCSAYAKAAIEERGLLQGSCLAARRLARCHPWNEGGYDPVPPPSDTH
jgi:putative membrane protein insertion efficiency factor